MVRDSKIHDLAEMLRKIESGVAVRSIERSQIGSLPFSFFVLAFCISMTGCAPSVVEPTATMFSGEGGGCGSFLVYRFNDTKTLAVTVRVDANPYDLSAQPVSLEIGSKTMAVAVEVLQFHTSAIGYFCNDVGSPPPPIAVWKAVGGNIVFERVESSIPEEVSNHLYKISVSLTKIQLKNSKTGGTANLDEVRIEDVLVGWSPG